MGRILCYESAIGDVRLSVAIEEESLWLELEAIGALFAVDSTVVIAHLRTIYASSELPLPSIDGQLQVEEHEANEWCQNVFNLDAILSVGYRCDPIRATHFRIWAMKQLIEDVFLDLELQDEEPVIASRFRPPKPIRRRMVIV